MKNVKKPVKNTAKNAKPQNKPLKEAKTAKVSATKKVSTNKPKTASRTSCKVVSKKQPTKKPAAQPKLTTTAKPQSKRANARAGEFWTVNNKEIRGHKAEILKRKKNGKVEVAMITHSSKHGNIKLQENPQPKDTKSAYVVRQKKKTTINKLGKKHPDMKIKNKTDKAVIRKIKKGK